MAWIRYKKIRNTSEGLHRNSRLHLLFDEDKDGGALDVKEKRTIDILLGSGDYEVSLEKYGVIFDVQGIEIDQEPKIVEVVETEVAKDVQPKPAPRKRKAK